MWDPKHIVMTVVAPLALLAVGTATVVWPTYRQATALRMETASLQRKVRGLDAVNARVEALAHEYDQMQEQMDADLKIIPDDAEVARLIRRLSLPVDGQTVHDQTFTTGSAGPAIAGRELVDVAALPLTVDMESNFDSVFALIRAAESMERLVRVSSVRVQCDRAKEQRGVDGHPLVTATVGLEAVYRTEPSEETP